ncbi:hypothetical protein [Nitrospira moscoviensis]|uniref:Uncharacterized protein n=1 Tax=Nitrospira moscoviensis TaxID=42253 RepID=A0A0K2GG97_NITMO|nr:hypothetical protein [Nitrospira moscoviensis]ALA59973.1 hypothetical protein NITMOv2_3581 [Nitrospira moscoviensis]
MGSNALPARYLTIGRQLAHLLGASLQDAPAESLRELARAYDPSAQESRINAEVFLFYKYLLVQTCVGVFPESETDRVVAGFFAALNERAEGLDFNAERQAAMESLWLLRAGQFDDPFGQDRVQFLGVSNALHWKRTIFQFCQNVHEMDDPPDIWAGADGPSQQASRSVTETLDHMVSAVGEMKRLHFHGAR